MPTLRRTPGKTPGSTRRREDSDSPAPGRGLLPPVSACIARRSRSRSSTTPVRLRQTARTALHHHASTLRIPISGPLSCAKSHGRLASKHSVPSGSPRPPVGPQSRPDDCCAWQPHAGAFQPSSSRASSLAPDRQEGLDHVRIVVLRGRTMQGREAIFAPRLFASGCQQSLSDRRVPVVFVPPGRKIAGACGRLHGKRRSRLAPAA